MRRSDWIHSVTWFELVNTVCLLGFAVYVLVPAHPLVAFFEDRGVTILYLLIAGLLVALGLISLAVRRGFGKREPWGWWFALVGDLLISSLVICGSVSLGWLLAAIGLLSATVSMCLPISAARLNYWPGTSIEAAPK
jgi:hypothetical protein